MSPYASYVLETALTLLAVSALAFVLLYGAGRAGVGRPTGGIDLVGRLPIDARRSVVLVRAAGQVFVVGVSEAGLTRLGQVDAKDLPPLETVPARPFASLLRGVKADGGHGGRGVEGEDS